MNKSPDFIVTRDITGVNAGKKSLFLLFFYKSYAQGPFDRLNLVFVRSHCIAGMFFFRNSEWSLRFLEKWWNQTSFIRPFGQMKSGDNDALKYLIQTMPEDELKQHVRITEMQCAFNSYLWRPSLKNGHRLMVLPRTIWQG